jgi:hypothetical protein
MQDARVIKIDLDQSDKNGVITADELIQRRPYFHLVDQIRNDLAVAEKIYFSKRIDPVENEKYPPGSGLSYFIDGTRGAGKSTFLRSAFASLINAKVKVTPLCYIDPSRIENSEIILLTVLKALAEEISKLIRTKSTLRDEPDHQKFRNLFKKLAGGLSLFAKDHNQLQYLDPELFLDHGLEKAGHSQDLRENFHALLDTACQLFGVNALVIAFDDADTKATHAIGVLECLRNYLDTPRLVVLVTGDLELYSLLVRDHFFSNLNHSHSDFGEDRRLQRLRMVDHLESQYLLKLFPIKRRLQLRPLWNLLQNPPEIDGGRAQYAMTCSKWSDETSVRPPVDVIDEIISLGLRIKEPNDVKLYREFLLKQPLRSVLQLLSRCAPHLSETQNDAVSWNLAWNEDLSESVREGLRAMALGSLYKFGIDVDAIAAHELPTLIDAVFELSNQDGDPDTAAYLRPQPSREDLKICFPALAADVAGLCARNPAALIQYMLAGPGSVSLFGYVLRRKPIGIEKELFKVQFKQYMGTGRKDDALNWARHATAIIAAPHKPAPSRALIDFGVIGLNKDRPEGAKQDTTGHKTIAQAITARRTLPVFALSLVDVSGSSNRTYASIFNILGIISRLLNVGDVSKVLSKPFPPLSISCPEWEGGGINFEDDEDELERNLDGSQDDSVAKPSELLLKQIELWIKESIQKQHSVTPSSILIGKIWTRMYFSLEKASYTLRASKFGPASLMQMFALCVVNAFLVEEADHHLSNNSALYPVGRIDRSNPLTSAEKFILKKFPIIAADRNQLPLTYIIATCPLILGLLKKSKPVEECISALISPTENSEFFLCNEKDWDAIEKTFIAGRWKKTPKGGQSIDMANGNLKQ